jgi:hypothetical protein
VFASSSPGQRRHSGEAIAAVEFPFVSLPGSARGGLFAVLLSPSPHGAQGHRLFASQLTHRVRSREGTIVSSDFPQGSGGRLDVGLHPDPVKV